MQLEQSTVLNTILKLISSLPDGCGCEVSCPLHYREFIRGRDDIAFSGQSFRLQAIDAALAYAALAAIARSTADALLLRWAPSEEYWAFVGAEVVRSHGRAPRLSTRSSVINRVQHNAGFRPGLINFPAAGVSP